MVSCIQSIATGIEGLDCSKSSPYKLSTASPIKLYHERVSRTGSVFPIFRGYKLIDKPVQTLYGLVLQSRPHSIPVAIDCTLVHALLAPVHRRRDYSHRRGRPHPCTPPAPACACQAVAVPGVYVVLPDRSRQVRFCLRSLRQNNTGVLYQIISLQIHIGTTSIESLSYRFVHKCIDNNTYIHGTL
jgi:hypothetical protein